jgi:hypothetical protein
MTIDGPAVVVVGAGYEGKRRCYERLAALGARLVIVDEPGHWSESLADQIAGTQWLATPISGDPDADAAAVLGALERSGVRPDGVLTFWEDRVCEAARVAAAMGLPGNAPEAVDAARSKVRTRELSARLGLPTPKACGSDPWMSCASRADAQRQEPATRPAAGRPGAARPTADTPGLTLRRDGPVTGQSVQISVPGTILPVPKRTARREGKDR